MNQEEVESKLPPISEYSVGDEVNVFKPQSCGSHWKARILSVDWLTEREEYSYR